MLHRPQLLMDLAEIFTRGVKHHSEQSYREKTYFLCIPSVVSCLFLAPNFGLLKTHEEIRNSQMLLCNFVEASFKDPHTKTQLNSSIFVACEAPGVKGVNSAPAG